ncbi:MAG: protease SohB [Pseudobdellovibrionaceae bacterium]|nr:protease SohB [Bdellovibrionales bacterium]USN48538.1 MAG: protease SohB [Pseudobdellovibrionaceae bacterium]
MDQLLEIAVFAGKIILIVVGVAAIAGIIASQAMRFRTDNRLIVEHLNKKYDAFANALRSYMLDKKTFKGLTKKQKKSSKSKKKEPKNRRNIFVVDFHGDIKASAVDYLRDEITAVLSVAEKGDEVVVRLESPGGMVHSYGLAASQLARIKEHKLHLTVCVDKVAASGGYMMACTGNKIIAAPFAVLGSIGVLAQVPNFHKLLKKHDVDYEEFTAGEYKRTLTLLGEITDKKKEKFVSQIEDTHTLFKDFVSTHRPQLDMATVATGEHWYGTRAKGLGLLDEIMTSDEYLFSHKDTADIYALKMEHKKKAVEKISEAFSKAISEGVEKAIDSARGWKIFS